MRRASFACVFAFGALASCATVSGLADKETVDCPAGCEDGAPTPTPTSTSTTTADSGPPIEDGGGPEIDAQPNFTKPNGWELVAVATVAAFGNPPSCPSGFDEVSDVGTNPQAVGSACVCATCSITQQAVCAGQPNVKVGTAGACGSGAGPGSYSNNPAGGCNTDFSTGLDRTGLYVQVRLAPASGGACAPNPAEAHPERVQLSNKRRVCDETSRCNGDACDATVPAPFTACVASPKGSGDMACPAAFPTKLVAGRANVACNSSTCNCSLSKTDCTGSLTYYKDANCLTGAASVIADDTCRDPNTTGTYAAYKVTASAPTSCTANGTSAATLSLADTRTICCPP